MADAVADGSCYVGVTTEDLALQAADSGLSITVVYPAEGAIVQPDCAAIVRDCAHEDNARAFIDFLLSSEVQTRLARQLRLPYGAMRTPPCPRYCSMTPTAPAPIRRSCWPSGGA